jgi:hypothetical protein
MNRAWVLGFLVLGMGQSGAASTAGLEPRQVQALPEYVVKAGFLFNFAKYVEWPPDAFEKADSPISIGIVGADPFGEELDKALRNKMVKERGFAIHRFPEPSAIKTCHILFTPRTENGRLAEILKKVDSLAILTVGEDEGFIKGGGVVNILIEKEKPRLEVNPEAAEKAHLTINSKLLKAATIVRVGK